MTTGLLYDERYLNHDTGFGHPECPQRISSIVSHLQKLPIYSTFKHLKPKQTELDWILTTHTADYIKRAQDACKNSSQILDTPDVVVSKESFEIAKLAAGGALRLADELIKGNISNGFAILRPPGHHAEANRAMGFCLFNNIAILARYLQKQHAVNKIVILDWDVHHGNCTQHTFYEDPSVFYMSLHQYPFYPGTGSVLETGEGRGVGTTLNCPMSAGTSDKDYKEAFIKKIIPAIKNYKPDIVLISAGFDAHKDDPLANINLSTECFKWMSERIAETAGEICNGRIISLLEGGYNLKVLPLCVEEHLKVLAGS